MFKSLMVYRLPVPFNLSLEQFEAQLLRGFFVPCPSNAPNSCGWFPPRAPLNSDPEAGTLPLVHSVGGQWIIRLCSEDKILPSSVIQQQVDRRVAKLTVERGHAPGRRELKELKERVTEELLPNANVKRTGMRAWIDPQGGWLVIDANSRGKADSMLELLRRTLDQFPVRPVNTVQSPSSAMTDWLTGGEAPEGFTIDRDCQLTAIGDEKASVRYVRHPLGDEVHAEIKAHLAAGKVPASLALTWDERMSFVLTEKLEIKRLVFLDLLKEQAEKAAEHADEQFDADVAIYTGEIRRMLPALLATLGGEAPPASEA